MDGFHYVNLFDTKGIEYIIIIAFLLLIIPFWKLLNRPLKSEARRSKAALPLSASLAGVPQGLYFSNSHTWALMQKTGEARIGIDRLLISLAGQVKFEMLREPGSRISKGEEISEIVHEGKRLTIVSPVSGTLTGINHALYEDPSLLNDDPYGKGWLVSVKPANWMAEVTGFHFAAEAVDWLRNELERIRDFLAISANRMNPQPNVIYLQDGGEPAAEALASMPEEVWHDFQKEFLR